MPTGFVFTTERLAQLNRSPQTPARTLDTRPQRPERRIKSPDDWRLRGYWREMRVLDGDGRPTGKVLREQATTVGKEGSRRAVVTIVGWEDVHVTSLEDVGGLRSLSRADALACGFRTVEGLRGAWRDTHPRLEIARLYSFFLGDRRDRTVWLASTRSMVAGRQGDYTQNAAKSIDRDAPLLTPAEYEELAMRNAQKDAARRAALSAQLSQGSLAERAARLAR